MVEHLPVPIDGSDNAERAVRFGAEMARRYDAAIDVVHITDVETESTEELLERADGILEEEGLPGEAAIE